MGVRKAPSASRLPCVGCTDSARLASWPQVPLHETVAKTWAPAHGEFGRSATTKDTIAWCSALTGKGVAVAASLLGIMSCTQFQPPHPALTAPEQMARGLPHSVRYCPTLTAVRYPGLLPWRLPGMTLPRPRHSSKQFCDCSSLQLAVHMIALRWALRTPTHHLTRPRQHLRLLLHAAVCICIATAHLHVSRRCLCMSSVCKGHVRGRHDSQGIADAFAWAAGLFGTAHATTVLPLTVSMRRTSCPVAACRHTASEVCAGAGSDVDSHCNRS